MDKSLWTDRCDYIDLEKCDNLNNNNMNLIVLQLNIRSLLVHQDELKDYCSILKNETHLWMYYCYVKHSYQKEDINLSIFLATPYYQITEKSQKVVAQPYL